MKNDFCDGVFAPVCAPEVCDVPRIPYYQDLVVGEGYVKNNMEKSFNSHVKFCIHIYRELFDVFGELMVLDECGETVIYSKKLECYHSPNEEKMVAIFHFDDKHRGHSKELSVYASTPTCKQAAKFYIYSAPLMDPAVCIGGVVECGTIKITESLVEHDH